MCAMSRSTDRLALCGRRLAKSIRSPASEGLLLRASQARSCGDERVDFLAMPTCELINRPHRNAWLLQRANALGGIALPRLLQTPGEIVARRRECCERPTVELFELLLEVGNRCQGASHSGFLHRPAGQGYGPPRAPPPRARLWLRERLPDVLGGVVGARPRLPPLGRRTGVDPAGAARARARWTRRS